MSTTIPNIEPTVITAGDTLRFTRSLPDYLPADGWALTYAIVRSGSLLTVTGSDNGDGTHLVEALASETASWGPGHYRWQATVAKGTDRFTVGRGLLEVRANFAGQSSGYDGRSSWRTTLDNLQSAYAQMSSGEIKVASVDVGGRVVAYRKLSDLVEAIRFAQGQVAAEEAADNLAAGLGSGRKIFTRFTG